jgi:hypothetical protein
VPSDFETTDMVGLTSYASTLSEEWSDRVAPPVARASKSPIEDSELAKLLDLLPALSDDERTIILSNSIMLARALIGRRGP